MSATAMGDDTARTVEAFSDSYTQARSRFLHAAGDAGLAVTSYRHPLAGVDGEELALDVVLDGPQDAGKLLILSSGCHGVEGYCGSGVQLHALRDPQVRAHCASSGVAVLHLHAINPYGFSHTRRVTHENVDVNRNFQDFTRPLPDNASYRELHPLLLPETWPPSEKEQRSLDACIATRGMAWLQRAVSGGQYEVAAGLFYGGAQACWSNRTLRQVLRSHAQRARQIGWIDLHTGLGATGHCERGYAGRSGDVAALNRARDWWDGNGATPVTQFGDASSVSAPLTGLMWSAIYDECPAAEVTAIGMEFGTRPLHEVMQALRAEQWLVNHPQAPREQAAQIKRDLRDAFYIDTPQWKQQVLSQALQALAQGVDGLGKTTSGQ